MQYHKKIFTRLLPKTGCSISIITPDDGSLQKGWWAGRRLANNLQRFIDINDEIILDRATGLMWEKHPLFEYHQFSYWLDRAANLRLGGYSNWRIPNVLELLSIVNFGAINPAVYRPYFNDITDDWYFTSTKMTSGSYYYWCVDFYLGSLINAYYYNEHYCILCRSVKE